MKERNIIFLSIIFFILIISCYASAVSAGTVTLAWDAPNTNKDGSRLTDLVGYRVYYGTSSHHYFQNFGEGINIGNVTTYTVTNLTDGTTYYFSTTAYSASGHESDYSNEVSTTIPSRQFTLTVNKTGTGSGRVTSSPAGIICGSDCTETYSVGTVVTLTGVPSSGSTFAGWSGSGCSGMGTCSITINTNTTVTGNFTIAGRFITVTSPNGGEVIPSGSVFSVQWVSPSDAVKFVLMYSVDNGITWVSIPNASNVITGTSYNWTVPKPWDNRKNKCLIKVKGYDTKGIKIGADKSNVPFTIEVVKVTSPNGGETLTPDNLLTIAWTINATKKSVAKVKLYYTKDGGTTWLLIDKLTDSGYLTEGSHSYLWRVPTAGRRKENCKVKVEIKDTSRNTLAQDKSDGYFTIQP